jgi:hypothetical protein
MDKSAAFFAIGQLARPEALLFQTIPDQGSQSWPRRNWSPPCVVGKMISPQSLAVATAATGMVGEEGSIFRFALKHSVAMVLIISLITLLQAYVLKFMLP